MMLVTIKEREDSFRQKQKPTKNSAFHQHPPAGPAP